MLNARNEQTVWSLQSNVAELSSASLTGRIDVTRPDIGLHAVVFPDRMPAPIRILGAHRVVETRTHTVASEICGASTWPLPVAEAYIRGNDLVAGYKPGSDWPFSPQLYWRANSLPMIHGELGSISLLVSVQTHLLDTCPQIGVSSLLPFGELVLLAINDCGQRRVEVVTADTQRFASESEICCVLMRPQNWPFSYVEMMAPSDFRDVALQSDAGSTSCEWQLFADFLEKGVIRRARIHAAFLPRENDIELAAACCEATRQLELPLTS